MYIRGRAPVILIALAAMLLFSISCGLLNNVWGGSKALSETMPGMEERATETVSPSDEFTVPSGYTAYSNQDWLMTSWLISPLRTEPASVRAGEPVKVWANIYISDIPMSFIQAELSVDGALVDSKQLVFWFDDTLDFYLTFTPTLPGEYDVVVRANMLENEGYVNSSGEDLSLYSSLKVNVTA